MDESEIGRLEKAFGLIAAALWDMERMRETDYEEEKQGRRRMLAEQQLRKGIGMYMLMHYQYTRDEGIWEQLDVTSFLNMYAARPVKEWFRDWDFSRGSLSSVLMETLKFWDKVPQMVTLAAKKKRFYLTEECENYVESNLEKDILQGMEQRIVYERMMAPKRQDFYVAVRKFLIEHETVSAAERQDFLLEWGEDTALRDKLQEILAEAYDSMAFGVRAALKRGVKKYIAVPGQLELAIQHDCEKLGLRSELWPHLDAYDIGIMMPDGEWAVDAKAYSNPFALRKALEEKNGFIPKHGWVRGFYVVPDNKEGNTAAYCKVINEFIQAEGKAQSLCCVTEREFMRLLRREAHCGK